MVDVDVDWTDIEKLANGGNIDGGNGGNQGGSAGGDGGIEGDPLG